MCVFFFSWWSKLGFHCLPPTLWRDPERKTFGGYKTGYQERRLWLAGPDRVGTHSPGTRKATQKQRDLSARAANSSLLSRVTSRLTYRGCRRRTRSPSAPRPKCPGTEQSGEAVREPPELHRARRLATPRLWPSKQPNEKAPFCVRCKVIVIEKGPHLRLVRADRAYL